MVVLDKETQRTRSQESGAKGEGFLSERAQSCGGRIYVEERSKGVLNGSHIHVTAIALGNHVAKHIPQEGALRPSFIIHLTCSQLLLYYVYEYLYEYGDMRLALHTYMFSRSSCF